MLIDNNVMPAEGLIVDSSVNQLSKRSWYAVYDIATRRLVVPKACFNGAKVSDNVLNLLGIQAACKWSHERGVHQCIYSCNSTSLTWARKGIVNTRYSGIDMQELAFQQATVAKDLGYADLLNIWDSFSWGKPRNYTGRIL